MTFKNFDSCFECTFDLGPEYRTEIENVSRDDIRAVVSEYGGMSFNKGIYRVLKADEIAETDAAVILGFPEYSTRITSFAFDWLGRVFAVDSSRNFEVVMIEFGAGEAMKIPCDVTEFHENELPKFMDDALAKPFFDKWLAKNPTDLKYAQCVGYKVPLFLNGGDTLDNLELTDRSVYWHLCAQLRNKARTLREGQKLGKIEME